MRQWRTIFLSIVDKIVSSIKKNGMWAGEKSIVHEFYRLLIRSFELGYFGVRSFEEYLCSKAFDICHF